MLRPSLCPVWDQIQAMESAKLAQLNLAVDYAIERNGGRNRITFCIQPATRKRFLVQTTAFGGKVTVAAHELIPC